MSTTSKITLAAACIISVATVGYVHYKQMSDRDKLHEGVIKDVERQQRRKIENLFNLQKQDDLTKQLQSDLNMKEKSRQWFYPITDVINRKMPDIINNC